MSRTVPGTCHCGYISEPKNEAGDLRPGNGCQWSAPIPSFPAPPPPPSPLEVGQLLLQQEHVGFEFIPLLKDLLKFLSTEEALSYLGGVPWLKDRFGRWGCLCWRSPAPRGHPRNARASDWQGDLGGKGAATDDRPVLWLRVRAEAGWGGGGGAHTCMPPSNFPVDLLAPHSKPFPSAHQVPDLNTTTGTHRVLRGPWGPRLSGCPLGLLPLLVPGPPGLVLRRLRSQRHCPLAL